MTVAIVTGASRGIGKAIALQLADDGMNVAVNDIQAQLTELEKVKAEIEQKGRRSICVVADVSREDEVKKMVQSTVDELGELNVMIASAGIIVAKRMFEVSVEEFDRVQAVNVGGVFLCYREAGRQMIKQGKGGKIVGACSTAGYRPSGSSFAYGVSKWAVRGLTQTTALELAEYDINVNGKHTYCPGPVGTAMWEEIDSSIARREGLEKGVAFERSVQARAALKRAQTPEDIAALVSFLSGPKSRNITGQSILVDGGISFS